MESSKIVDDSKSRQDMDTASLLSILIDLKSIVTLAQQKGGDSVNQHIINSVAIFCNSYSLLKRNNKLQILGYHAGGIEYIFPRRSSLEKSKVSMISFVPSLADLSDEVCGGFITALRQCEYVASLSVSQSNTENSLTSSVSKLHAALSTALTTINHQQQLDALQGRILCLRFDKERELHNYNAVMNCIFSAQKMDVLIDCLIASPFESLMMQQACFLANGIYLKKSNLDELLPHLLTHFLSDGHTRKFLRNQPQSTVDFKASCHCCREPTEFAYMCSVCLTLLCDVPKEKCPVCESPLRATGSQIER